MCRRPHLPGWRRNFLTFRQTRDAAAAHCLQGVAYFLAVDLALRTGWLSGRQQQLADLLFDTVVGGLNMLARPACWLLASWTDNWPGWVSSTNPAHRSTHIILHKATPLVPRRQTLLEVAAPPNSSR